LFWNLFIAGEVCDPFGTLLSMLCHFVENRLIDGDLRRDALALQRSKDWDDTGPQLAEAIGTEGGGAATASSQV
jgi:hypothetical protein